LSPTSLWLPGLPGNNVQCPDAAWLDITGDICIVADVTLADWSPATDMNIVRKDDTVSRSYGFNLQGTTGAPYFYYSTNGTAISFLVCGAESALSALPDNTRKRLAVAVDVNNGSGGSTMWLWTSDDGVIWTLLATTSAGPVVSLFSGTAPVQVGDAFAGKIHSVSIRSGFGAGGTVGGTEVARYNADIARGQRYRDPIGNVFTHNGSAWALMEA
jgi:hypothetical protein